ncbi:hypothetical protein ACT2UN_000870 [Pseudomonas putida]
MPTENRSSNTEMVSAVPAPKRNRIYVEVRECEGCNHIGIDDAHSTLGACHECDWSGPEPVEDKCPGCGRENVIAAACPDCGSRYVLAASKEFEIPAPQHHAEPDGYPPCDYCGITPGYHPWHGSGMFNGAENRHIHACDDCRGQLPSHPGQHHAEPMAWMVGNAIWWDKAGAERDSAEVGLPVIALGPIADPGEVEALRGAYLRAGEREHELRKELDTLRQHKTDYMEAAEETRKALRAQLAERDALLRDIRNSHGVMLMTHPPQDPWLNNRIDERIRAALSVGGAPSQQELTEDNPNGQTEP